MGETNYIKLYKINTTFENDFMNKNIIKQLIGHISATC